MQPNNQTAGAAPELAKIEVENLNRSSFLVRGMLAAGALYGTAAVSPMVRKAFGRASMGDIDILNYALTLEYLEAAFYEGAAKTPGLSKEVAGYVKTFGAEEQEHVDALTATITDLGGTPVKAPKTLLATAGGIVQVEARHAATIRFAANEDPSPEAFDPTMTQDEVLKAVQPYVES